MPKFRTYRVICLWAALLWPSFSPGAEVLSMEVTHHRKLYILHLQGIFAGEPHKIFEILTDYPLLTRLNKAIIHSTAIPHLTASNETHLSLVLQSCIWFFCKRISPTLNVTALGNQEIFAVLVPDEDNFNFGWAQLKIHVLDNKTHVELYAELIPAFWIPPLIGPLIIKHKLQQEAWETLQNMEALM